MSQHATILNLQGRVIGWAAGVVRPNTRAYAATVLALRYLETASDLTGGRRTNFLRCARDQWRVAVRLAEPMR